MRTSGAPLACFNGIPSIGGDFLVRASRAAAAAALCAALNGSAIVLPEAVTRPALAATLPAPQLDAEHALAKEAWGLVGRYYRDADFGGLSWGTEGDALWRSELKNRGETYRAIRGALAKLGDPYTRLLSPEDMESLRKYDVSGVGLMLSAGADADIMVMADPLPGSPAADAGIARGDVLEEVDGVPVAGRAALEVARQMQGDDGTQVALRFRDAGDVKLTRNFSGSSTEKSSVSSFLLQDGDHLVGHVRVQEFRASSRGDVARAVSELRTQGADAFVLDIRGNPGGVFQGALEIAGIFEGPDVPVALVSSRADAETFRSTLIGGADAVDRAPLAVVVDDRSASASEVLAGGLRDTCRAAVVGDTSSYGKGVIQGVFGLSDGSGLVLTIAEYQTPKGVQIQGKGLVPNFSLNERFVDKLLHTIGVYGPARVDWERVQRVTDECRESM